MYIYKLMPNEEKRTRNFINVLTYLNKHVGTCRLYRECSWWSRANYKRKKENKTTWIGGNTVFSSFQDSESLVHRTCTSSKVHPVSSADHETRDAKERILYSPRCRSRTREVVRSHWTFVGIARSREKEREVKRQLRCQTIVHNIIKVGTM